MNYSAMLHTHSLMWFVMLVLFFVALVLLKNNRPKGAKIVQMSLRLFYILVLVTGGTLLFWNFYLGTAIKGILAIFLIFTMEKISTGTKKGTLQGTQKTIFWVQFVILVIVVVYLGFVGL
ncbi:DUF1516 family protein [Alteribacter aurantiacus]|uniref:DUF1516 family protein n=1 Tax=Alteribacter aurantiacus TaxID=254410 RepID=UPI00041F15CF|nr:DUF1516 family protein [Alteribacter aurantiacus]